MFMSYYSKSAVEQRVKEANGAYEVAVATLSPTVKKAVDARASRAYDRDQNPIEWAKRATYVAEAIRALPDDVAVAVANDDIGDYQYDC